MSIFLILLVIGMSGLVFMALPAFAHHAGGHLGGHNLPLGHHTGTALGHGNAHAHHETANTNQSHTFAGLIPSPRTLFSLTALLGAFGYALEHLIKFPLPVIGGLAFLPAYLVERLLVTPLWNYLIAFSSPPTAPLQSLTLSQAIAVTNFTNGRGMVKVVHNEREVQFVAQLIEAQQEFSVRQGDSLYIDEVDEAKERLTVRIR